MPDASTPAYPARTLSDTPETNASGISWPAIFAGAMAAGALYLILLSLGAGFGLSSVSPWSGTSFSSEAVGASAIVWLLVTEVLSSAMGGYLAGRLRTKWVGIHSDEVYFRDTAHGFLAWCTALVFTAAFLAAAATTLLGHSVSATGTASQQGASQASDSYFVDKLFRGSAAKAESAGSAAHAEAEVILARALAHGMLSAEDQGYLAQLVSTQTGLGATDSGSRVSTVFAEEQQAAETARKTVAHSLLWMFLALLLGAFTASFAATIGGRQRDGVVLL